MNERQLEQKEKIREETMQRADQVKGAIQIEQYAGADFEVDTEFAINGVFFDTILVQFEDGDADHKKKGGIFVPTMVSDKKVWRTGRVVMIGDRVTRVNVGDYVFFPNDKGINAKAVNIKGVGIVNHCVFIAEDRLFGKAERVQSNG